jgi:hypothetical protein
MRQDFRESVQRMFRRVPAWVKWLAGLLILLWLTLEIVLWWLLRPTHPLTVAEVEARVKCEVPIGSTREAAVRFMDRYCTHHDGHREPKAKEIGGIIRDTHRTLFVQTDIQILFYLDEQDRVVAYKIQEVYTGW